MMWRVWTDGSCSPRRGTGGWGAVLRSPEGVERGIRGGARRTTNNRMEFEAVARTLREPPKGASVTVYSDSQLVVYCMTGRWKVRKMRPVTGGIKSIVHNRAFAVPYQWIKGHNGDSTHERADALASIGRREVEHGLSPRMEGRPFTKQEDYSHVNADFFKETADFPVSVPTGFGSGSLSG